MKEQKIYDVTISERTESEQDSHRDTGNATKRRREQVQKCFDDGNNAEQKGNQARKDRVEQTKKPFQIFFYFLPLNGQKCCLGVLMVILIAKLIAEGISK